MNGAGWGGGRRGREEGTVGGWEGGRRRLLYPPFFLFLTNRLQRLSRQPGLAVTCHTQVRDLTCCSLNEDTEGGRANDGGTEGGREEQSEAGREGDREINDREIREGRADRGREGKRVQRREEEVERDREIGGGGGGGG